MFMVRNDKIYLAQITTYQVYAVNIDTHSVEFYEKIICPLTPSEWSASSHSSSESSDIASSMSESASSGRLRPI